MAETVVLVNAAAGSADDSLRIIDALRCAGMDAEVRQVAPREITATAKQLVELGSRLIVAAGGDGTINAVASAVIGSQAVLGVLPVGTLNHFARDLGLPVDLDLAVQVLASGAVRGVDVGEVNGRVFLNNCSIGLYPSLVIRRERQRQRLGRGKWLAMLLAFLSLFKRYPLVRVALDIDGRVHHCASPLVFVGNNPYETDLLNIGRRHSLSGGELSIYLADAPTRLRLLRLVFRGLFGKLTAIRDFQSMNVTSLTIESRKRRLRMAMDGEVLRLHPPLGLSRPIRRVTRDVPSRRGRALAPPRILRARIGESGTEPKLAFDAKQLAQFNELT